MSVSLMRTLLVTALAGLTIAAPFTDNFNGPTLNTVKWCPTYNETYGCSNTQPGKDFANVFAPSQVKVYSGSVVLTLIKKTEDRHPYVSGAFNGHGKQAYGYGTYSARIHLDCTKPGVINNWPGFWIEGTVGSWPTNGEIDIAEGLGGHVKSHYWFTNRAGKLEGVQVAPKSGNYCGWHVYAVARAADSLTFTYDGRRIGKITSAEIGVHIATDPMFPRFDYGTCTFSWCGPVVTTRRQNRMRVDWFRFARA